ncbi:glycosyltransferase family 4 protein [Marinirhabdus gelatinilytica]|uniref:Glycosyltransferase involved in cell wall biosynthesis n=1 Tax=Marinirhabdus gelatinilytica TaxID=1703343 RepID=A0A370QB35_9FLAO|nr:glycosyltransferase family 1 protein [Marinirhabdus gelatinilytica]RDK85489.1 glycosyltransferase involved in cell wall biosynthesis [Marinirhabdus gelatinilytica]
MKHIFLEAHNLKNKFSGFGQFNYHLIKGLAQQDLSGLDLTLNVKDISGLKDEFGNTFSYKKYKSITRHKPFRIKKKYDLWHCLNQNIKVEPFYKIPYLLTVHDIHFVTEGSEGLQAKLRKQFEKKLKRATAITYISEFAKKDVHDHFEVPEVPEHVIYNGNTITNTSVPESFSPNMVPKQPYLFSIGDFSERKNFKSLVEMLRFLPEYNLVLSGNDTTLYAEGLRELVAKHSLNDRVFITGKIGDTEKNYYLQNCEAFVFPSLREGFGIPPIEAMRFGKPVFLSNNTSLPEIGGEQSFYWDHYEPEYMASIVTDGLETFYAHQNAYENWYVARAQSFNWETTAKRYLKIYRSLL